MRDVTPSQREKTPRVLARAVPIALLLAGLVAFTTGCGKAGSERAAPEQSAAQATPTPDPGEPPSIRQTAASGEAPFSAVKMPFEAKVDDRERLWVLDSVNSRLRLFDANGGFLGGWGGNGDGKFSFKYPEGLAISGNNVYVADTWNHRVVRFTLTAEWKGSETGFMGPRGVAVGPDGSVWVADTGNHRVVKFDGDLQNRVTVGQPGKGPGEFAGPVGIAASPSSGRIYITDSGNRRVQVLDKNGKYLTEYPVPWLSKTWQVYLEVGPDETLYASSPDAAEVDSFNRSGEPGKVWKTDDAGEEFVRPVGLALDRRRGVLYVIDTGSHKVRKVSLPAPRAR